MLLLFTLHLLRVVVFSMRQPIAGIAPPELDEVTSMIVWPSIGAVPAGRWVGRLCGSRAGVGFFTLGKLLALATIPVSVVLYFWKVTPWACRRYRLTNRRIIVQQGLRPVDQKWIDLDQFDEIRVEILPGQEWLKSGELLFFSSGKEILRLSGVPRPEVFREVCLKARRAVVSVNQVLREQQPQVAAHA